MPAPQVYCYICKQTVTKRSTLSFGEAGRACRSHPEVQAFVAAEKVKAEDVKKWAKAERNFQIMMLVPAIRIMSAMHGLPVEIAFWNLRQNGYPDDLLAEVRAQVDELGPMSAEELGRAMFNAILIQQRLNDPSDSLKPSA